MPAGSNDGRRLYIHEGSFHDLAMQSSDAAALIFAGLVALPLIKLVHHDLVEEGVALHGFDLSKAEALERAVGARWFDAITNVLQGVGVRGPRRSAEPAIKPLLGMHEKIVATCLDASYYTFATTEQAAARMYADVLKLSLVRALVRAGGDAYRDLTMIRGRGLSLVHAPRQARGQSDRPGLSAADLEELKIRIAREAETTLAHIIEESVAAPTASEQERLGDFRAKCIATVRHTVLHLS